MKKYTVLLSNGKVTVDSTLSSINKNLAKKCEDIEKLLNIDYNTQEPDLEYGELHSLIELTNENTDEKNLLTIFEKEMNNIEFFNEKDELLYSYELSNKEINYINNFRKVLIDEKIYKVVDIMFNFDENNIKGIISE